MSQSLSSKLQVITHNRFVIIHNKPVIQNKKPPETISFPAALPVSFHGIGTVCCKADILPEVINDIFAKENSGERQLGICFPRQIQIAISTPGLRREERLPLPVQNTTSSAAHSASPP